MNKLYSVSYRLAGKVQRKGYASEKRALRTAWKWLKKHEGEVGKSATLYGPGLSPLALYSHRDEALDEFEQEQRCKGDNSAAQFYQSQAWLRLRAEAFHRYGNHCAICGRSPANGVTMHVDHIKPRSTHPELALDIDNLQILCEPCNRGKGNKFETQWR